jgi:predicted GIY-YIG superfamily endonuclease
MYYYVYFLKSLKDPSNTYIGYTTDLKQRLKKHNAGGSPHTSKFKPWKLITFIGFDSEDKAIAFEKYIKVGSGHAFAKRKFW